jgi:hypothetical protein
MALAARMLINRGYRSYAAVLADRCIAQGPQDVDDMVSLARALDDLGRSDHGDDILRSCEPEQLAATCLFEDDKRRMIRLFGDRVWREAHERHVAQSDRPDFEGFWEAREEVKNTGDPALVETLIEAGRRAEEIHDRIEAIDCLDTIGFRALARQLAMSVPMPETEPYWLGELLLRFGLKAEAIPCYLQSASEAPNQNESLVLGGLASLGEAEEIARYTSNSARNARADNAEMSSMDEQPA